MDKLKTLYAEIDRLNDEIPAELAKKIHLYAQVLQWVGRYHSDSTRDYKKAYADRKRAWGEALLAFEGTGKEKEGAAEVESYKFRKIEADAEAEMWRWRNSFAATQEIINSLKIQLKTLMKEYDGS